MSYGNESLDELERFLNTKPQTYAVAIGVRAAERAFPLLVHTDVSDAEAQEMVFLAARALLVASAFGLDTSSESRRAAVEATVEATNKLGDARGEPVFVVENVSEAIGCAAVLPVAPAHMATKYAADGAMLASEAVGNASFWRSQVHGDEELAIAAIVADMSFLESGGTPQELMDCTLWDNGVPASILDAWRDAQRWMRKWEGFEFWTGWYRSVIGRRAMAKTLLREVARIEPSDWSLGPKHVSNIIEKIELAWIRASSPLAETIEWIPDTRKLRAVPVPLANVNVWDTVIDKLRDALNDIQREGALKQQHAALADVVATLERTVSCYADNPQRVHDDMNNALLEIGDLLAGGEIAKDSRLRTFRRTLETNSTDICAWSPEVAESVWRRTMVRVEQLSDADQDILRSSALTAAEHTEGTLQTDLREDVTMVMPTPSENLGSAPTFRPRNRVKAYAAYRLVSRLSRMLEPLREHVPDVFKKFTIAVLVESFKRLLTG